MAGVTMRAAVFRDAAQDATLEELSIAPLRPDEVLVKLVATGVCHTDLTCRNGFMALPRPIVLGHEGAGVVEQVGDAVTDLAPGDHVVMSFLSCGRCPNCQAGEVSACYAFQASNFSGRRPDGSTAVHCGEEEVAGHFFSQSSFATYSVANARNVVKVRKDAPLELLGPLGCGVQTGAGSVMNVLKPRKGQSIAVFGAGGVGLSAVIAAGLAGCGRIIVVEPRAERRNLALELGATDVIDPGQEGALAEKLQAAAGGGLDHALDTCGIPEVIGQAFAALAPGGRLGLVTMNSLEAVIAFPLVALIARSITVHAINMGASTPREFIPKLVDLIVEGHFPIQKLVCFYDFADINQALADQESGRSVKPILKMA